MIEKNNSFSRNEDSDWSVKHTVTYDVNKSSARVNNLAWTYCDLAESALDDFYCAQGLPHLNSNDDDAWEERQTASRRLFQAAIKVIVFSAMACEAAIYDLAATHLSDQFATKVLDKLDPVGKWLVVPRLICGGSLRIDGPAINSLRTLISIRNTLVHHKSLPLNVPLGMDTQKTLDKGEAQLGLIITSCEESFRAIVLLSLEIARVLGTSTAALPSFRIDSRIEITHSVKVQKLIERCYEIDKKAVGVAQKT